MRGLCVAVVIAAVFLAILSAPAAAVSIIYYTDFEELPMEMVSRGGWCEQYDDVVTCHDGDMGAGYASYYLYHVDLSNIDSMWISTRVRLPEAPSTSVNYGIAVLSSNMDKAYIAVIDSYNGWIYILSWNVEYPYGWGSIGDYVTGMYRIPEYDSTKWYTISLSYRVAYGAVTMYFSVDDADEVLAEVWATSYFASGAFYPAYIGFVVDEGSATFDYLLAATAPTSLPAAVTTTSTVTVTETQIAVETQTVTTTSPVTVTNYVTDAAVTTISTVASPVFVHLYRTVTETVTTMPATVIGFGEFAIVVAVLIMAAALVFMLRRR